MEQRPVINFPPNSTPKKPIIGNPTPSRRRNPKKKDVRPDKRPDFKKLDIQEISLYNSKESEGFMKLNIFKSTSFPGSKGRNGAGDHGAGKLRIHRLIAAWRVAPASFS